MNNHNSLTSGDKESMLNDNAYIRAEKPNGRRRGILPYRGINRIGPPCVSIITPFYHSSDTLPETADSVLAQSWQNWEWIIVDDGSTLESSAHVLSLVKERDSRIIVLSMPENSGISAARNQGLRSANGQFVCWLDSDDLIEPTFLEKCVARLTAIPEISFTKGYTIGFGAEEYLWTHGFHDRERFLRENRTEPTSVMRTSVARAIGGFDETIRDGLEDWDFWLKAADAGYWGDTIAEPLCWYRRRQAHLDRWKNLKSVRSREEMEQELRRRYPRLWKHGFPQTTAKPRSYESTLGVFSDLHNQLAKKKPRLLLIVPHLELGGADRVNRDIISQLSARFDWEVTLLTTRRSADAWAGKFYEWTSDVFTLHRFLPASAFPGFIAYLIESRQPDLVLLSQSELGYRLLPWLKTAFPSLPIVDLVHIVMNDWQNGGYPRFSVDNRDYLDHTFAVSSDLKEWLADQGGEASRIEVLYCNTDPEHWTRSGSLTDAARSRWSLATGVPIILFAGRFTSQKQPRLLRPILEYLHGQNCTEYQLVLAGDGPDRGWLEANLCNVYPDRVLMVGNVDPDEMRVLMSAVDILLLPSEAEGIALVIYEAMSMQVVPIATCVGGQRELVTPDCGFLVPVTEDIVSSLAQKLLWLLEHPSERAMMGIASRKRVETYFSLDRMGRQLNDSLKNMVLSNRQPLTAAPGCERVLERLNSQIEKIYLEHNNADEWQRRIQAGRLLPRAVSGIANWLRCTPAARVFRRFEIRYGERIGRWLMRNS